MIIVIIGILDPNTLTICVNNIWSRSVKYRLKTFPMGFAERTDRTSIYFSRVDFSIPRLRPTSLCEPSFPVYAGWRDASHSPCVLERYALQPGLFTPNSQDVHVSQDYHHCPYPTSHSRPVASADRNGLTTPTPTQKSLKQTLERARNTNRKLHRAWRQF